MNVLITRPRPDADRLAALLRARGHHAILAPMLEIMPLAVPMLPEYAALLLTSRHAGHALASLKPVPAYAVGQGAQDALHQAGFTIVTYAETLIELLPKLRHASAPLLYLRGRDVAHDVPALLAPLPVQERIVYEARAAHALPPALDATALNIATFLSARTAQIFAQLAPPQTLTHITAIAFSEHIAAALRHLPWQGIIVCKAPTLACLVETVDKCARGA